MRKLILLNFLLFLLPGLASAQTRWMRLHPEVSWKYLKQWEKTHQWLTPAREGKILFQKGKLSEARARLEKALVQGSEDGRIFYELGYCYQSEGNEEKAIYLYQQAVEKLSRQSPDHLYLFNSHYLLGNIYEEQEREDRALEHYEKALQLCPEAFPLRYRKSYLFRQQGNYELARAEIAQVTAIESEKGLAHYILGLIDLEAGSLESARSHFQEAINQDTEATSSLYCLGLISAREGKLKGAVDYHQKALQNDPENIEARIALGNIFYEEDNLPRAQQYFQELSRREPSSSRWHYNLGVIYRQMGRDDLAEQEFQKARSLDPELTFKYALTDQLQGLSAEAARLYAAGKLEEAVQVYKQAVLEDPFFIIARYNLAVTQTALGEASKAMREYSRLLRIEPDYMSAHLNLGILAYQKKRRSEEAAHHLRRYLELEPESDQADVIKRYLHEIRGW